MKIEREAVDPILSSMKSRISRQTDLLRDHMREEDLEDKILLDAIFERPTNIARSESIVGMGSLLDIERYVHSLRFWLIEHGRPSSDGAVEQEIVLSKIFGFKKDTQINLSTDLVPQPEDPGNFKLHLMKKEPGLEITLIFDFLSRFQLTLDFRGEPPRRIGLYDSSTRLVTEMTEEESTLALYFLQEAENTVFISKP